MPKKGLDRTTSTTLFALIFASGACALLYQVVWHKYLAILIGSHARATAIVLAVFLGGMGIGYQTFGNLTRVKKWRWFHWYAGIELALGLWAMAFPFLYKLALPLTGYLFDWLGVGHLLIDIFCAFLLLGAPTFLMGAGLPILTHAVSDSLRSASRIHAKIYGWNTVGAAVGCFVTGYAILPYISLTQTLFLGASINIIVAGIFFLVFRPFDAVATTETPLRTITPQKTRLSYQQYLLLGIGLLSGFYVFTLETLVIRLAGLSVGASYYHFTLVVSIFVLMLGFGSLWIKNVASYRWTHLLWLQVAISIALMLLAVSGDYWSYGAHLIRISLRDQVENFLLYQVMLVIALTAVLIIPVGLCGITMPLCFHLFKVRKDSLGASVGMLYAANTVGAVLGALIGGYLLFYWFNLDALFKLCAALAVVSVALASIPLLRIISPPPARLASAASIVGLGALIFAIPNFSLDRFFQPFRHTSPNGASYAGARAFGTFLKGRTDYVFYSDGPNTSIGIGSSQYDGKELSRSIFVNGKSDGNTSGDMFTTVMLAHVAGLLTPKLDNIAVIGFGTGMTVGELTLYKEAKNIDLLEISPVLIGAAHHFDRYNRKASKNHKVNFREMDAFRYLAGTKTQYDLIVSEPSNPWVTGVENLFSQEFYQTTKSKLTREGTFVQWIHTYSFSEPLFRMVLKTMNSVYPFVSVFQLKGRDLLLFGSDMPYGAERALLAASRLSNNEAVQKSLNILGFNTLESILALEIVPQTLTPFLAASGKMHRLESPKLSQGAAKAFFSDASLLAHKIRRLDKSYLMTVEDSLLVQLTGKEGLDTKTLKKLKHTFCDNYLSKVDFLCDEALVMLRVQKPRENHGVGSLSRRDIASLAHYSGKGKAKRLPDSSYAMYDVFKKYYSPVAYIPHKKLTNRFESCMKRSKPTSANYGECLLQRILFMVAVELDRGPLQKLIGVYKNWFAQLDTKAENYAKFKNALGILEGFEDPTALPNPARIFSSQPEPAK